MSIKSYLQKLKPSYHIAWARQGQQSDRQIEHCPYCLGRRIIKRGQRRTKRESIQLYRCKDCEKTFTSKVLKGKQYASIFNNHCNEWGDFSLDELESYRGPLGLGIERDLHFPEMPISEAVQREAIYYPLGELVPANS